MPLKSNQYEERTKELTARLEEQLMKFTNQEEFKRYLSFLANMRQYSVDNQLLIFMQNPQATYVAGFQAWKKHNRFVQRGEKGIQIRAPLFEAQPVVEKGTNEPIYENGKIKTENVLVGYKWVTVFDLSQTAGEELKVTRDFVDERFQNDAGAQVLYENFKGYLNQFKQLHIAEKAYSVKEQGRGYYVPATNEIVINASEQNPVAKLRTLIHEFAHAQLHGQGGDYKEVTRAHKEAQAESVAYATMTYLGFDTSHYSVGYIATWAKDTDLMRKALQEIQTTLEKTLATLDVVLHPQLYEQLEQIIQKPVVQSEEISPDQLAKHLPALSYVKSPKVAIEVFDARYMGFEVAQYDQKTKVFTDERGERISREMLAGKDILLLNVIDRHPTTAVMYNSFSEQFALREVLTPKPVIELYHRKTDTPLVGYNEVKEAKASFLHAAASENHTVKAYIYGKDELRHFKPVLEVERERIERVEGNEKEQEIKLNGQDKNVEKRHIRMDDSL